MTIQILPPEVAERIAAGEVVERPESVVKELIENALDAGAAAIQIEIKNGGLSLMRVSDDGAGIPRAAAPLVFARFATSKIRTIADLAAIRTLGFRGEALAAIATVANVEIVTRATNETAGTRITASDPTQIESTASPIGTSVTVRGLFYNTPARRKFIKSPLRESELIQKTIVRYALAYPAVAFKFITDGREKFAAPSGTLLERVAHALGRDGAAEMIEITWEAIDLRVSGYISRPTIGRSRRDAQFFFVNGRPIRAGLLAVMLERPYAGRLPPGRHPLAVIQIEIDPQYVDVNAHPRKAEVRFAQERSVYGAVARAVADALSEYPVNEYGEDGAYFAMPFAAPGMVNEMGAEYAQGELLQALAQAHRSYIIAQSAHGVVIVDQHAAHEQVLFEQLLRGEAHQELTPPARFEVTAREVNTLKEIMPILAESGWEIEPFGGTSFLIRAVPAPLVGQDIRALLTMLIEEATRYHRNDDELCERLAAKAACVAAVKAGDALLLSQMQQLLNDFAQSWSPATCPHGRSAVVSLSLEELARRFGRC